MFAVDFLVAAVLTPSAINTQLTALNSQYAVLPGYATVPALDPNTGVFNMWTKAWSDVQRPSVGYEVGFLREARMEIVLQGKNRDELPLWITYVGPSATQEVARRNALVTWEAIRMVLDTPLSPGLEGQQLPGVSPVRGIVKIEPALSMELVDVTVAGAGNLLGFRSRWLITVDTVRP
jgi:hypothetical protein